MTCSIEGCERPAKSKTWCSMHYKRWWRNGSPTDYHYGKPLDHLLATYDKPEAHDSWPFAINQRTGYARLTYEGKDTYAHTVACTLAHGPRPAGLIVLHSCLNPACYWSEHLEWGTYSKNLKEDRRRDGTDNRGERNPLSKVTWNDVEEIRDAYAGGALQRELAEQYGISRENVGYIVRRDTWR